MNRRAIAYALRAALGLVVGAVLAQAPRAEKRNRGGGPSGGVFLTEIPAGQSTVIAGRPTDQSVTLSILMARKANVQVVYGETGAKLDRRTEAFDLLPGEPRQVALRGLRPDSGYEYRVVEAGTANPLLPESRNGAFHTCRAPGSRFVFTITADSHLDGNSDTTLYAQTLNGILAEKPDFHMDLGDTFMTGKHGSRESAVKQYLAQRYYFGQLGAFMPVFLVIGNHDGEEAARRDAAGPEGLAVWSCLQRKRYFPNPEPDAFYAGNTTVQPYAGLLQDYYAWTWGDALFVVLDPYWTSAPSRGMEDPWAMSLGKTQADWLARTLRASTAKFKFVFIHQLVGGLDRAGRGGAEATPYFEWGGHEKDGRDSFAAHRPGWDQPIHSLLRETGVTAVFHGHDHFFAHQERDGIAYQLVPQPASRGGDARQAEVYGYQQGRFLPSPGFLRVAVSSNSVAVRYVRTGRAQEKPGEQTGGYGYVLEAKTRP